MNDRSPGSPSSHGRPNERGVVSWEAWNSMQQEIERLQAENAQLTREADYWREETNRWYMKAN